MSNYKVVFEGDEDDEVSVHMKKLSSMRYILFPAIILVEKYSK